MFNICDPRGNKNHFSIMIFFLAAQFRTVVRELRVWFVVAGKMNKQQGVKKKEATYRT